MQDHHSATEHRQDTKQMFLMSCKKDTSKTEGKTDRLTGSLLIKKRRKKKKKNKMLRKQKLKIDEAEI